MILYTLGVLSLLLGIIAFLLDRFTATRVPRGVSWSLLSLGIVLIVIGWVLGLVASSVKGYSFIRVVDDLKQQQAQGLTPIISKKMLGEYFDTKCVVLKMEKDETSPSEVKEDEDVVVSGDVTLEPSNDVASGDLSKEPFRKEPFRWIRRGRRHGGRWRGYPYYRYWRFPYTRFIRYPYIVKGPGRWVTYNGDYYYVTI